MFFVYIIYREKLNRFYVGYTANLETRIELYHHKGRSTYTSKGIPWKLKYKEEFASEIQAMRREKQIKKMKNRN